MTNPDEESQPDAPEHGAPPPAPRWVKVFAIVLGIILLSVIILHATGHRMGGHGGHRISDHGQHSSGRTAMIAPGDNV